MLYFLISKLNVEKMLWVGYNFSIPGKVCCFIAGMSFWTSVVVRFVSTLVLNDQKMTVCSNMNN